MTATEHSASAEVRERIFLSALRLFSEKGFAATSLREIAIEARTTKPMIYYYFESKEGLYSHIVHEILDDMAISIRARLDHSVDIERQIADFCEAYLTYFLAQEEVIALVLREVFGLGGAPMAAFARTLGDDVREPLDTMLRQGMETGRFRADEVVPCATAITGILNMFILGRVFAGADIHVDAALRQVSYYVQGLLKQP